MRTKLFKAFALAAVVTVGGAACTDLVVEPKSTVTAGNIFQDLSSYESFIGKIYGGLALTGQQGAGGAGQPDIAGIDEGFSHYIRLIWQMQTLPTDEAVIAWNDQGVQELNTTSWGSANQFLDAMYSRIYIQVALVNEFLRETTDDKLAAVGLDANDRATVQQYRAEARFLRALSYWHGIDLFGGIPLVDENFPIGDAIPEQATRQAVYDYVVSELNEIRGELPGIGAAEYGRADQGAVAMLLAKVYMNAEVYTGSPAYASAFAEVQNIISSGAYELDDDVRDPFLADNDGSPEMIFPVPQDGQNTRSFGGTNFLTHASVGGNMDPGGDYGLDGGWWGLRIQPEIVDLFNGGVLPSGDARADEVIVTDGHTKSITNITDFFSGYPAPKFRNISSTGAPGSNPQFADVDYPMFRYSDALLMYAELFLRGGGGDEATAVGYINDLRERAYGDASGNITAGDLDLDFVLDERARELYWEGHRRTDLVRYGLFSGSTYTWEWKGGAQAGAAIEGFKDLYPLPASELLANPNLSQNPGY